MQNEIQLKQKVWVLIIIVTVGILLLMIIIPTIVVRQIERRHSALTERVEAIEALEIPEEFDAEDIIERIYWLENAVGEPVVLSFLELQHEVFERGILRSTTHGSTSSINPRSPTVTILVIRDNQFAEITVNISADIRSSLSGHTNGFVWFCRHERHVFTEDVFLALLGFIRCDIDCDCVVRTEVDE